MKSGALTPDSQAVLLLCSTLALPGSTSAPKPLSRSEWNDLARTIGASDLRRPGALFGLSRERMREALEIPASLAERVSTLMERGGQLSIEVERLQALGIWVMTRADETYPAHLRERLKALAPPVLWGAGPAELLTKKGVAILGSRNVDDAGGEFARTLGQRCAASDFVVFSGGARGVDRVAVDGALDAGGSAVAVLADSLEDAIKRRETRSQVLAGRLALVTPIHPSAKFTAAAAMGRNKLIYALASWAVVVAAEVESGGTWAGALENLRAKWVPLFVRDGDDVPAGNRELITRGARPLVLDDLPPDLESWLERSSQEHQSPALLRESSVPYAAALEAAAESETADPFAHVWPRLASYLAEPRTESEVAIALGVDADQAKAWLARGVQEGLLTMLAKPVRFQRVRATSQTSLFDA